MKARALRRGSVTGLIALVQTTRLTGGYDFMPLGSFARRAKQTTTRYAGVRQKLYKKILQICYNKCVQDLV